jgi:hypothetical protein
VLCCICPELSASEEAAENAHILETGRSYPLFVSLGANCTPASMFRHFSMRDVAFPFDWALTIDDRGLISALEHNFADFVNRDFFIRHPSDHPSFNGHLVHSLYHIVFSHDWDARFWDDPSLYQEGLDKLIFKFKKRIAKFQALASYPHPVIFVRTTYPAHIYSHQQPQLYWYGIEDQRDEKELAIQLHDALKKLFPNLNFILAIVHQALIPIRLQIQDDIILYTMTNVDASDQWEEILSQLKLDASTR